MPKSAIDTLNKAVTTALKGEAGEMLRTRGYEPVPSTPAAFEKFMRSEIDRWGKAVKSYGIKAAS